jgi:hypothetical protein
MSFLAKPRFPIVYNHRISAWRYLVKKCNLCVRSVRTVVHRKTPKHDLLRSRFSTAAFAFLSDLRFLTKMTKTSITVGKTIVRTPANLVFLQKHTFLKLSFASTYVKFRSKNALFGHAENAKLHSKVEPVGLICTEK